MELHIHTHTLVRTSGAFSLTDSYTPPPPHTGHFTFFHILFFFNQSLQLVTCNRSVFFFFTKSLQIQWNKLLHDILQSSVSVDCTCLQWSATVTESYVYVTFQPDSPWCFTSRVRHRGFSCLSPEFTYLFLESWEHSKFYPALCMASGAPPPPTTFRGFDSDGKIYHESKSYT